MGSSSVVWALFKPCKNNFRRERKHVAIWLCARLCIQMLSTKLKTKTFKILYTHIRRTETMCSRHCIVNSRKRENYKQSECMGFLFPFCCIPFVVWFIECYLNLSCASQNGVTCFLESHRRVETKGGMVHRTKNCISIPTGEKRDDHCRTGNVCRLIRGFSTISLANCFSIWYYSRDSFRNDTSIFRILLTSA